MWSTHSHVKLMVFVARLYIDGGVLFYLLCSLKARASSHDDGSAERGEFALLVLCNIYNI